ncbi:response regulator [Endozoicomonas atrinae]|uniref:response regulator n=1 Tax=Endozoicomonas atrinae TaxID=1333660 RepID=UPI00082643BE|nr:response regulator [Endozoicomonas atrinae]
MEPQKLDRILLVEDSYHIRSLLNMTLTVLNNYQVYAFDCGETALNQAADLDPQLIILDVMMPGMDGPTVMEKLKTFSKYRDIPYIFLTSKVHRDDLADFERYGVTGVIAKPFEPTELSGMIESIWAKYHQSRNDLYKDQFLLLQEEYLENLHITIDSLNRHTNSLEQHIGYTSDQLDELSILINDLCGSGKTYGFDDISSSAQILVNFLATVDPVEGTVSLSERDSARVTALILGLITIIEKACEDAKSPERLKGSISFTKQK